MNKLFIKYQDDPEMMKMIRSWNREHKRLTRLKQELRTRENVDEIIEVSNKQLGIRYKMWDYIYDQEEAAVPEQRYKIALWMGALILVVGIANLALLLGLFD